MALRTYLPRLLALLRVSCKYIKRYDEQIRENLPNDAARTALTAVLVACEALEAILDATIPPGS